MTDQHSKPWKHAAPGKSPHTHLSPAKKRAAKARASHAGRTYPNLVDNMWAAHKAPARKPAK